MLLRKSTFTCMASSAEKEFTYGFFTIIFYLMRGMRCWWSSLAGIYVIWRNYWYVMTVFSLKSNRRNIW